MTAAALRAMLEPGDLRSTGRSAEAAQAILDGRTPAATLLEVAEAGPRPVTMRALDALEKASHQRPDLLNGLSPRLLALSAAARDKEARWHLAQLVPRCQLAPRQRAKAVQVFRSYLDDSSSIVRTFALEAIVTLAGGDPILRAEARKLLAEAAATGTPAMKARAKKLTLP